MSCSNVRTTRSQHSNLCVIRLVRAAGHHFITLLRCQSILGDLSQGCREILNRPGAVQCAALHSLVHICEWRLWRCSTNSDVQLKHLIMQ